MSRTVDGAGAPRPRPQPGPVLLVLRALGLGDFLTGVPALRALADAFPDHRRLLATPEALAPVAAATGAVHGVVPASGLQPLPGLTGPVDVAVNLHGRGPHSHRVLTALAPRRLIAFAHPDVPASNGGPEWRPDEHEVRRWCRLLEESGVPARPDRLDIDLPAPARQDDLTVVHPGAAHPARRWPAPRWAEVARHQRLQGRRVVVTGGPDEMALAGSVAAQAGLPPDAVVAGRTDVMGLAGIVKSAGLVVCGDTGVAHLATALGTPSVVLFGPTPPGLWGPPVERVIHRALWAGQTGDPFAGEPHAGLMALSVEEVISAVEEITELVYEPRRIRRGSYTGCGSDGF